MGTNHCKMETVARMLGEPLKRTRERVDKGELPLVVRNGERLVPTRSVLELRERLLRKSQTSSSRKPYVASPNTTRREPAADDEASSGPKEFSAPTVAEAVGKACSELGVEEKDLAYEIRDSGLLHVLGLGSGLATIVARVRPPRAPVPAPEGGAEHEGSTEVYPASGSEHYYSVEQAASLLGTGTGSVEEMVRRGELPAEMINGYLRFPSNDVDDLVVRRHGSGRLAHGSDPYPAAEVRRAEGLSTLRARPAKSAEGGHQSPAESAEVGNDRRVIVEAAQRFGTSINDVKDKVARGELVYQPEQGKLVEVPGYSKNPGITESTRSAEAYKEGSPGSSEREQDKYITVRDLAYELGEPVNRVVNRLSKKGFALRRKKDKRLYVLRRDALMLKKEIREPYALSTQQAATSSDEADTSDKSLNLEPVPAEDHKKQGDPATSSGAPERADETPAFSSTKSWQGGEAAGVNRSSTYDLQVHSDGVGVEQEVEPEKEIQRLRSQLEEEQRLRREREERIRDLQGELEESKARENGLGAGVEVMRTELADEKAKVEALLKEKLLLDTVRQLANGGSLRAHPSSGAIEPGTQAAVPEQAPGSRKLAEAVAASTELSEVQRTDEVLSGSKPSGEEGSRAGGREGPAPSAARGEAAWLPVAAAAEALGVHPNTVYKYIRAGKLGYRNVRLEGSSARRQLMVSIDGLRTLSEQQHTAGS